MTNKERITANNADLQEILDKVNALPDAGAELPELTNPGTAGDLVYGKEMIDANGNLVTGSLRPKLGGLTADVAPQAAGGSMPYVKLIHTVSERTLIEPAFGGQITFQAPFEAYGDAAAADVAKGKTFTSAAGLLAVGTKEETAPQLECGTYLDFSTNSWVVFVFEQGLTWEQYENSAYNIGMLGSQFYVGEDGYVYNGSINERVLYDGGTGEKVLGTDLVKPILYNDVGSIG